MPDFYIGAHAGIGGLAVLTRGARRFRDYFPGRKMLCPEKQAAVLANWMVAVAQQKLSRTGEDYRRIFYTRARKHVVLIARVS